VYSVGTLMAHKAHTSTHRVLAILDSTRAFTDPKKLRKRDCRTKGTASAVP
jgi:hypothetical protein